MTAAKGMGASGRVSHVSEDGRFESVIDHLSEVSHMAAELARPFGGEDWAALAGMAHDIGKYSQQFQDRILHGAGKVDHSTAGAYELCKEGLWQLAYCVAGHHGGLPDGGDSASAAEGGTLFSRLRNGACGRLPDYGRFEEDLDLTQLSKGLDPPHVIFDRSDAASTWFSLQFFIRMVFSCLVDADYLCTERFVSGQRGLLRSEDLPVLCAKLENGLAGFYPPKTSLDTRRCGVLDACLVASSQRPGVFSLTVPTGGGKTLASLRFALHHAVANEGMRRVVYAIPYTSIIDQNAREFRRILGAENVLEHHASFDFDEQGERGERLRLAAENWEAPVVVTTNVQLFESLYARRTSRCRKLHNIAGSVIVLDEAQMIPTEQLLPCVRALVELVENYRCSIVLCTATQPSLDEVFGRFGLAVSEIMPHPEELFAALERVEYRDEGELDDEELAARLCEQSRCLCIVNSRRQAKRLYNLVEEQNGTFHLTTFMHPAHRERVIDEIRHRLSDGDAPCRVIATSLVEAGVNLDFPVVYRALSGIDSVIQAAGRCNREGRIQKGVVHLFRPKGRQLIPRDIDQKQAVSRLVLNALDCDDDGSIDIGSLAVIDRYFELLYRFRRGELDGKGVLSMLSDAPVVRDGRTSLAIRSIPFESAAKAFSIIDDASFDVIVAADASEDDIAALEEGTATRMVMRRLSRFSVGVYEHDLKKLIESGAVDHVSGGVFVLLDASLYSNETGLDVGEVETGKGIFF